MLYRAIVFCDPECLLDVSEAIINIGQTPPKTDVYKAACEYMSDEDAAKALCWALPRFIVPEFDYLAERYNLYVVEPIEGQRYFERGLGQYGCSVKSGHPNVGYAVQAAMDDCKCPKEEVLKVYSSEYTNLTMLIKDWKL